MIAGRRLTLDALRGFAALSVLLMHSAVPFFSRYGGYGLDLFFVLSGYCIHWGSTHPGKPFSPVAYLKRRWWRIYPPYFFALALALGIILMSIFMKWSTPAEIPTHSVGLFQVTTHLLLIHNWFVAAIQRINGPFWTIALEAQFYLLYLLIRPLLNGSARWAIVLAVGMVLHFVSWELQPVGGFQPWQPFCFWVEWLLGAYAGHLVRSQSPWLRFWPVFGILFLVCFMISQGSLSHTLSPAWQQFWVGLSFFLFLLACLHIDDIFWSNTFTRWLPEIGLFSYSIYLIHHPLIERYRFFIVDKVPGDLWRVGTTLVGISGTLIASYLFFLKCEKPYLLKR